MIIFITALVSYNQVRMTVKIISKLTRIDAGIEAIYQIDGNS